MTTLEPLVSHAVYRARITGRYGRIGEDGRPDPLLEINNSREDNVEVAEMVVSRNAHYMDESRALRAQVIDGSREGEVNVDVLCLPKYEGGKYVVCGTERECTDTSEQYDMRRGDALSVLDGQNVFYARCMKLGHKGDLIVRAYTRDETFFGFLKAFQRPQQRESCYPLRLDGYNIITEVISMKKPGDYLVVRQNVRHPKFFYPVINFKEIDIFNGKPTRVNSFDVGSVIENLPIPVADTQNQVLVGRGHVLNLSQTGYLPVWVLGLEDEDVGKFFDVRITQNRGDCLVGKVKK